MATATAARQVERELVSLGDPQDAELLQTYFKTGPGQYGEGDVFLGIRMPVVRTLARRHRDLELADCRALLDSPHHETLMLALLILVGSYHAADAAGRDAIYELYLGATDRVNNWDLVDLSAPGIVGRHLEARERSVLLRLARSNSVWELEKFPEPLRQRYLRGEV